MSYAKEIGRYLVSYSPGGSTRREVSLEGAFGPTFGGRRVRSRFTMWVRVAGIEGTNHQQYTLELWSQLEWIATKCGII